MNLVDNPISLRGTRISLAEGDLEGCKASESDLGEASRQLATAGVSFEGAPRTEPSDDLLPEGAHGPIRIRGSVATVSSTGRLSRVDTTTVRGAQQHVESTKTPARSTVSSHCDSHISSDVASECALSSDVAPAVVTGQGLAK